MLVLVAPVGLAAGGVEHLLAFAQVEQRRGGQWPRGVVDDHRVAVAAYTQRLANRVHQAGSHPGRAGRLVDALGAIEWAPGELLEGYAKRNAPLPIDEVTTIVTDASGGIGSSMAA